MPFDWKEYLELARFLQGQQGSGFSQEAASRCAVSRAYFAIYCLARNYAVEWFPFTPTREDRDHIVLRDRFQKEGRADVASGLQKLRQWRNTCDYENTVPNADTMLTWALREAQKILEALAKPSTH